jgi:hypothetical protein
LRGTAPGPLDTGAFDRISISVQTNRLVLTNAGPGSSNENDGFEHLKEELKPGEALKCSNAVFQMVAFGVALPVSRGKTDSSRVPADYFSPDGRRLSEADLTSLGLKSWERGVNVYAYEHFPKLRFLFGSKAQPPGWYSMVGLFDARTKRSLTSGCGYSQVASNYLGSLELEHQAWHATPLELVLDVQLDGRVVVESNLVAGTTIPVPGGMVKVLGVWDGKETSWSSIGNGGWSTMEIQLGPSGNESNSLLLYACEPPGLAVLVDCLDAEGKRIAQQGGSGGGAVRSLGLGAKVPEGSRVQLTVFTNHHLVSIPLGPIPGLPAENQGLGNLFAARVPWVQFQTEEEMREFIGRATQMSFLGPPTGNLMPAGHFPLVRTNTTPALLLAEFRPYLPRGYHLAVDERRQEIRIEPTLLVKGITWLRQKLGL